MLLYHLTLKSKTPNEPKYLQVYQLYVGTKVKNISKNTMIFSFQQGKIHNVYNQVKITRHAETP